MKAFVKLGLTKIGTKTNVDFRISKAFWQLGFHLKNKIFFGYFK